MKYISKISHTISTVNKRVEVNIKGLNLIIMGGNVSGKTAFVLDIYKKLHQLVVEDSSHHLLEATHHLNLFKNHLATIKGQEIQRPFCPVSSAIEPWSITERKVGALKTPCRSSLDRA